MPARKSADRKPAGSKAKKSAATPRKAAPEKEDRKKFPIVGLGASAGGLQALKAFFARVAPNNGIPKTPSTAAWWI